MLSLSLPCSRAEEGATRPTSTSPPLHHALRSIVKGDERIKGRGFFFFFFSESPSCSRATRFSTWSTCCVHEPRVLRSSELGAEKESGAGGREGREASFTPLVGYHPGWRYPECFDRGWSVAWRKNIASVPLSAPILTGRPPRRPRDPSSPLPSLPIVRIVAARESNDTGHCSPVILFLHSR